MQNVKYGDVVMLNGCIMSYIGDGKFTPVQPIDEGDILVKRFDAGGPLHHQSMDNGKLPNAS